ncbi:aldose 1-epimerase-like protein [Leishmania donovani]|uniref:Aldose 1-epimerase family protein n=1 Tax=Leishmania donovani TaxID=5661 RepID=A0A3S7WXI1_LEIDO|nr:aldose 1-epimerase-like protein [Leishmania donovani]AYU78924.1 aldose 1-epimerase-like protein [Leishmania donovani]TPP50310.1 Aldose 1-epimerase family protein [Leishmania donovani]TPP51380.1 Aldose 1-epimerase family protein [Leishmania donovani]CAJ1988921.1 aldose 1-epimerase-like protein [Leishmania donovani]CBZ34243.1 aldose 1-epimerase-like protein [Leishmania donovani]
MADTQPVPATVTSAHGAHAEAFGESFIVTLSSENLRVQLLSHGAALNSVKVRKPHAAASATTAASATAEQDDEWLEVCLGYTNPEEALSADAVVGHTIGRYAGRIANGEFEMANTTYTLAKNFGPHNLHGGPVGFQHQEWKYLLSDGRDETGVAFHLVSPHMDQGFPGELFVTATYSIIKSAPVPTLKCVLQASLSDHTPVDMTVINLTNHAYWNLNGVPRPAATDAVAPLPRNIENHYLQLQSKYFAVTDELSIPHGDMRPVEGTPHDYSALRCVAEGMEATKEEGRDGGGYDDLVALETWDSTLREAALVYSPATKLRMQVCTTNPAIVVYTANHLPANASGAKGQRFQRHSAICLECQYFPNSPNVRAFPSTVLKKGEAYNETTTHAFQFMNADITPEEKLLRRQ